MASFRFRDRPRCVHQTDMAERLREVAEQLAGLGVDLFGQQPDVVDEGDGPFENDARARSG